MNISTGEGTQERRERRRAETAVKIGDKAGMRVRRAVLVVERGIDVGGTVKNHKSDEGALVSVRKGRGEVGVSKRQTEVFVKTA